MKFATSLASLAYWLMAIVSGVYLLAYLSVRYLRLPSAYYYTVLALAATGYAVLLFLMYQLKHHIHNSARNRDKEASVDCMNDDQWDERTIE